MAGQLAGGQRSRQWAVQWGSRRRGRWPACISGAAGDAATRVTEHLAERLGGWVAGQAGMAGLPGSQLGCDILELSGLSHEII